MLSRTVFYVDPESPNPIFQSLRASAALLGIHFREPVRESPTTLVFVPPGWQKKGGSCTLSWDDVITDCQEVRRAYDGMNNILLYFVLPLLVRSPQATRVENRYAIKLVSTLPGFRRACDRGGRALTKHELERAHRSQTEREARGFLHDLTTPNQQVLERLYRWWDDRASLPNATNLGFKPPNIRSLTKEDIIAKLRTIVAKAANN